MWRPTGTGPVGRMRTSGFDPQDSVVREASLLSSSQSRGEALRS